MSGLRRLFNRADRWLDRTSLRAPRSDAQRWPGGGVPALVSHALERAMAAAQRLDDDARLKQVSAPLGTQPDGAARRWEFVFELPRQRARLACDWYLDGDAAAGRFGRECLDLRATPFPPPGSPLAQALDEGRVAYGSLRRLWREERKRRPDLSLGFRDSDAVVVELMRKGLQPAQTEFSLSVVSTAGGFDWIALTRDKQAYRVRFA